MSNLPDDLKYTKTHEWVRTEADGSVTIGISDHAQGLLGDIVFIELPEPGTECSAGDDCAVIESVKAASDIYAPISGEITAVNEELADAPETINNDSYGDGWIFKMAPADAGEVEELMDHDAYKEMIDAEDQ